MDFADDFAGVFFATAFFVGAFADLAFVAGFAAFAGRRMTFFFAALFTAFLGIRATSHLARRRKYVQRAQESQGELRKEGIQSDGYRAD